MLHLILAVVVAYQSFVQFRFCVLIISLVGVLEIASIFLEPSRGCFFFLFFFILSFSLFFFFSFFYNFERGEFGDLFVFIALGQGGLVLLVTVILSVPRY